MGGAGSKSASKAKVAADEPVVVLKKLPNVTVGTKVMCLDEFTSKYSGKRIHKWRPATVVSVKTKDVGRKNSLDFIIKIHYDGWSDANDINVIYDPAGGVNQPSTSWRRLALPFGMVNDAQAQTGRELDPSQLLLMNAFLSGDPLAPSNHNGGAAAMAAAGASGKGVPPGSGVKDKGKSGPRSTTDNGAKAAVVTVATNGTAGSASAANGGKSAASSPGGFLVSPMPGDTAAATSTVGSGKSDSAGGYLVSPMPSNGAAYNIESSPVPSGPPVEHGFKEGDAVEVLDSYKGSNFDAAVAPSSGGSSKAATAGLSRWRRAIVREVTSSRSSAGTGRGNLVRVHYVGWDDSWDEVLDMSHEEDAARIAKGDTHTMLQSSKRGSNSKFGGKPESKANSGIGFGIKPSAADGLSPAAGQANGNAYTMDSPQVGSNGRRARDGGGSGREARVRRKSADNSSFLGTYAQSAGSFIDLGEAAPGAGENGTGEAITDQQYNMFWNPDYYTQNNGNNEMADDSQMPSLGGPEEAKKKKTISVNVSALANDGEGTGSGGKKSKSKSKLPTSPYRSALMVARNLSSIGSEADQSQPSTRSGVVPRGIGPNETAGVPAVNMSKIVRNSRLSFPGPSRKESVEENFVARMEAAGLHIVEVGSDGNCLFRAVAHQMYLDENRHQELRDMTCDFMIAHKDRYASFCASNFDEYISHLRRDGVWGDHLEIKALEEIFDRLIIIYDSESRNIAPMNLINMQEKAALDAAGRDPNIGSVSVGTNYGPAKKLALTPINPILLSYHGRVHYNSVYCDKWKLPLPLRPGSKIITKLRDASHCF